MNSTENNINNKLRSRRSTSGLNCSESLTSFKSISNTVNNMTNSSDLNMIATHQQQQQQTLTRNKSMVRLTNEETKQNNDSSSSQVNNKSNNNKKTANLSSAVSTTSSSSSSTSTSSSWLAQSFRKAFGSNKTENQTIKKKMNKNKNPKMMSSSLSINNYSTNNNCNNTTIDENRSDRNSCNTTSSKRSSLSDDENESEHKSGRSLIQNNNNNKLSLLPNHFNDTDSEYEEDFKKNTIKHKNVSLISKRSYRSESELVTKFQIQQQQLQQQKQLQTKTNDESTYDTFNSKKLSTLNEINNPINIKVNNTPIRNVTKLSKTHKSVNSLLINSNTNENQFYKLQEINQSFYNQTDSPQTMTKVMSMQKFTKW